MPVLQINLLGGFSLAVDGSPVPEISAARFQGLIAYLSLQPEALITRRQLASLFWPDSRPSQARANLRKLIFDLRHAHAGVDRWLETSGSTLHWQEGTTIILDVKTFEDSIEQAQNTSQLEAALELYRGELLPGNFDDWVLLERQRLEGLYVQNMEKLIQELEGQRNYGLAIHYTQRLINIAPIEENNYRQLMRLYALNGDRTGLVSAYNLCADVLQRELDIRPSPLTRNLYQRLIQMGGGLNKLEVISTANKAYRAQWAQLQSAWRTALTGHPYWAILVGETQQHALTLIEELVDWAGRLGIPHTSVTCYPTDVELTFALPEAILRAQPLPALNKIWMVELSRLLPEILADHPNLEPPGPMKEAWQIHRFHEALSRAFLAQTPHLLLIHNLQWSDPQSLRWLAFLQRYDPEHPHLIVASLLRDELAANPRLSSLLDTLEAQGQLTRIPIPEKPADPVHDEFAENFYLAPGLVGRSG